MATHQTSSSSMVELEALVCSLRACTHCPGMQRPAVSGGAVLSKVMTVGQAPGDKEPVAGRPFAWTAGKTLFRWFSEHCGVAESEFRSSVYMAAVCRCFPGKKPGGGDRVPDEEEITRCAYWLDAELQLLRPSLIVPIGKLAINQFLPAMPLTETIGKTFQTERAGVHFDVIPLPHPSGASPWHRMEPGKTLLIEALQQIQRHPAWITRTEWPQVC